MDHIYALSEFDTQIRLFCPRRDAKIYYTLGGSVPTRHDDNTHVKNTKSKKTSPFLFNFKFSSIIQMKVYVCVNQA